MSEHLHVDPTTGKVNITSSAVGSSPKPIDFSGVFVTGFPGGIGPAGPQGVPGPTGPTGGTGVAGATGPQGPAGPMGATGASGAKGIQGDPGATGSTGPQGSTGPVGATGATGAAGPQGPQGNPGTSVVLKGSVANHASLPSSGNTLGDLFVTLDTGHGWVWSSPGQWNDVGAIQGPAGPPGATGATGAQGPAGSTGAQGTQGTQGIKGDPGPTGTTGATGPQGLQGLIGATGAQGTKGDTGATGAQGAQGIQGNPGATGSTGPTGPQGPTGPPTTPAGTTQQLQYNNAGAFGGTTSILTNGTDLVFGAASELIWNSDTAIRRQNLAGVGAVSIDSGTPGDYRDLILRSVKHNPAPFANLPSAPSIGQVATVSGATAGLAWGAVMTSGSGLSTYLVWWNGANWTVIGK